eukprot:scaffold10561_cov24-Tisochrysis_lutea.AAC.1
MPRLLCLLAGINQSRALQAYRQGHPTQPCGRFGHGIGIFNDTLYMYGGHDGGYSRTGQHNYAPGVKGAKGACCRGDIVCVCEYVYASKGDGFHFTGLNSRVSGTEIPGRDGVFCSQARTSVQGWILSRVRVRSLPRSGIAKLNIIPSPLCTPMHACTEHDFDELWAFSFQEKRWTLLAAKPDPALLPIAANKDGSSSDNATTPGKRYLLASVVIDGVMIVYGGNKDGQGDVWALDLRQ